MKNKGSSKRKQKKKAHRETRKPWASRRGLRSRICGERFELDPFNKTPWYCSYHSAKWRKFMDD